MSNIYLLKRKGQIIAKGTIKEISEQTGKTKVNLRIMMTPSYQKKIKNPENTYQLELLMEVPANLKVFKAYNNGECIGEGTYEELVKITGYSLSHLRYCASNKHKNMYYQKINNGEYVGLILIQQHDSIEIQKYINKMVDPLGLLC